MRKTIAFLAPVAALLLAPAARAQSPLRGDAERGGQLFRMECATCHGVDGTGSSAWRAATEGKNLGTLPDLRDSAFLAQRSDDDLVEAIRRGMGRNGWIPGHAFASSLSLMDTWDVVQWLRDGTLSVAQFYPEAAKFTAKDFRIDQWGVDRLAEKLNLRYSQHELDVVVLTVYRGERDRNESARLVPWNPVELDLLKASDRIGYLVFQEMETPAGVKIRVGLAIGTDGKLKRVEVSHPDEKVRSEAQQALSRFVGQGQKGPVAFKAPAGLRNGAAWASALTRAASLAAEGITMYEKSERARTAFDR